MDDATSRRRHERVRVNGYVRMMVDTYAGVQSVAGHLVDLSEGGCSIFVKSRLEENAAARINVEISGAEMWLPVVTRWARCGARGWTIGCEFDRPTPEKERAIRALVWERRNLVKS
jgi:c-di-GMP-binding flagellar brake protein YcgR